MSAALVRQALEFVDPIECSGKSKKRGGSRPRGAVGQDLPATQIESKTKKLIYSKKFTSSSDSEKRETISKLLKLSQPILDKETAKKIVKRATTGKPIFDKIKVKKEETKSILFPEDNEKQNKKKSSKKRQAKKN